MGWKIKHCICGCGLDYWVNDAGYQEFMVNNKAWNPTGDLNQAFKCLEAWRNNSELRYYNIKGISDISTGGYEITLFECNKGKTAKHKLEDEICTEYSVELPLAICKAIKQAMEG